MAVVVMIHQFGLISSVIVYVGIVGVGWRVFACFQSFKRKTSGLNKCERFFRYLRREKRKRKRTQCARHHFFSLISELLLYPSQDYVYDSKSLIGNVVPFFPETHVS